MPSSTRIQYELPSEDFLDRLRTDDLILRYVKDDYEFSRLRTEFYDTEDWLLSGAGYSLDATPELAIPVTHLARGLLWSKELPGLFRGETWTAPFEGPETMVASLGERGAPPEFMKLAEGKALVKLFEISQSNQSTTLYLPDRTRISMTFENGLLTVDSREERRFVLSMDLLFGEENQLINYCQQIRERFALPPVILSRHRLAQHLLRQEM